MRIDNTTATAYVTAAKSDESTQRDFLLEEFSRATESWRDTKPCEIGKLFNLGASLFPDSSQELIDAFANSKFTVDTAKVALNTAANTGSEGYYDANGDYTGRQFYGITFTDLPVADRSGYDAAIEAYKKQKVDTKRKIIVGTPADGLAALEALEAWMPTTPAN